MKRIICAQHIHYVRTGKSANLDTINCSICKYQNKTGPIRVMNALNNLISDLQFDQEHPNYDPHGTCILSSAEKAFVLFFKLIHPAYGKNLLTTIESVIPKDV